jgi:hypothetical protein
MARKAAAADPDSGTTNVNIADFQRTRDSVRLVHDMSLVFLLPLRVTTAHLALCDVNNTRRALSSSTPG